jgi:hypothetical protein
VQKRLLPAAPRRRLFVPVWTEKVKYGRMEPDPPQFRRKKKLISI